MTCDQIREKISKSLLLNVEAVKIILKGKVKLVKFNF